MPKKVEPDFSQSPGPALHSACWRFGPFELDETRRELRRDGELLDIEPKPLNMLMLLLRHPGELVTKGELLDALWTGRMVNEAVVGNCISSVREVLGDVAAGWLKTLHGFGYRFDAPVQLVEDNKPLEVAAAKLGFNLTLVLRGRRDNLRKLNLAVRSDLVPMVDQAARCFCSGPAFGLTIIVSTSSG